MTRPQLLFRIAVILVMTAATMWSGTTINTAMRASGIPELACGVVLGLHFGLFGGLIIWVMGLAVPGQQSKADNRDVTVNAGKRGTRVLGGALILGLVVLWPVAGHLSLDATPAVPRSLLMSCAVGLLLENVRDFPVWRFHGLRASRSLRRSRTAKLLALFICCMAVLAGVPLVSPIDLVLGGLACVPPVVLGYLGLREMDEIERSNSH